MKMWGGKAGGVIDRRGHLPSLSFFRSFVLERDLFSNLSLFYSIFPSMPPFFLDQRLNRMFQCSTSTTTTTLSSHEYHPISLHIA
jgi:hypothetical protein